MSAIAWQEAVDAYAEMAQALRRCAAVQTDALSTQQRLWILEEVETARRMLPALEHESINGLAEQASPRGVGRPVIACAGRPPADHAHRGVPACG